MQRPSPNAGQGTTTQTACHHHSAPSSDRIVCPATHPERHTHARTHTHTRPKKGPRWHLSSTSLNNSPHSPAVRTHGHNANAPLSSPPSRLETPPGRSYHRHRGQSNPSTCLRSRDAATDSEQAKVRVSVGRQGRKEGRSARARAQDYVMGSLPNHASREHNMEKGQGQRHRRWYLR